MCAADGDCGDTSLFCSQWRCRPGEAGTDARGCIDLGSPCAAGVDCDEDEDACSMSWCTEGREGCLLPGDCDGDGSRHLLECGGSDCDDDDPARFPGNPEACDAEGHDEDCVDTTFASEADGDLDGDDYVAATCCNGDACGDDCDDGDVNINPSASEVCDGIDNDCSGAADDAAGLCPGGSCIGGRCNFDAWDRAWGSTRTEAASAVAFDGAGAIYVAGTMGGTVDFGDGPTSISGGTDAVYVVKYLPDGTHDWHYVSPGGSSFFVEDLAVSPSGAHVYVVGRTSTDLGSGVSSGAFLLRLDGDGTYLGDRRFGLTGLDDELNGVVADDAGVVVAGSFADTRDFGDGDETAQGDVSMVVARYGSDGAHVWSRVFHATGTSTSREARASALAMRDGALFVGGEYEAGGLVLGDTLPTVDGFRPMTFVAWLDSTGTPVQAQAQGRGTSGFVTIEAVALGPSGRGYAAGRYMGSWAPAGTTGFGGTDINGFVLAYAPDGAPEWGRSFGGEGGSDSAYGIATNDAGSVYVAGDFSVDTSFGGSTRRPVLRDGFLAQYTSTGTHQSDTPYASGGSTAVRDVAVGPGDSVVIVGEFNGVVNFGRGDSVSSGIDAFLLRLGS